MNELWVAGAAYAAGMLTLMALGKAVGRGVWWLIGPRVAKEIREIATATAEIHTATTKNGGKNNPPTLPDKMAETNSRLGSLESLVAELTRSVKVLIRRQDTTEAWIESEADRGDRVHRDLTGRVERLEGRGDIDQN